MDSSSYILSFRIFLTCNPQYEVINIKMPNNIAQASKEILFVLLHSLRLYNGLFSFYAAISKGVFI